MTPEKLVHNPRSVNVRDGVTTLDLRMQLHGFHYDRLNRRRRNDFSLVVIPEN
jgi:hypothetical protein